MQHKIRTSKSKSKEAFHGYPWLWVYCNFSRPAPSASVNSHLPRLSRIACPRKATGERTILWSPRSRLPCRYSYLWAGGSCQITGPYYSFSCPALSAIRLPTDIRRGSIRRIQTAFWCRTAHSRLHSSVIPWVSINLSKIKIPNCIRPNNRTAATYSIAVNFPEDFRKENLEHFFCPLSIPV